MDFRPEPVSMEQVIVRAILIAGFLIGLAAIVYLLTRRATTARIRSSDPSDVVGWWGAVLLAWAFSWFAGGPVLELLEPLGSVAGAAIFILWLLVLVLLPAAALFATGIWIAVRPRQPAS
jgi:hypothetical protein